MVYFLVSIWDVKKNILLEVQLTNHPSPRGTKENVLTVFFHFLSHCTACFTFPSFFKIPLNTTIVQCTAIVVIGGSTSSSVYVLFHTEQ